MEELAKLNIGYLDDQEKYLEVTEKLFEGKGLKLKKLKTIDSAFEYCNSAQSDILLSDLDLSRIPGNAKDAGEKILRELRTGNTDIFLGLYTAYSNTLTAEAVRKLKANDIMVYEKSDPDIFLSELSADYSAFRENKREQKKRYFLFKEEMMNTLYADTLSDLNAISDKSVKVPLLIKTPAGEYYVDKTVADLIRDVTYKTETGMAFVKSWYQNLRAIDLIIKK